MVVYYRDAHITVRSMEERDCAAFFEGFAAQGWNKPLSQFTCYLREQQEGKRQVVAADWDGESAGYVTLRPRAEAGAFLGTDWPELCDFNVLKKFQKRGIGGKILDAAEALAAECAHTVVLGVGLHSGYGSAQRMYVLRGYVPDGSGVWYLDKPLAQYAPCANDDDLVLYLSKRLR